MPEDMPETLLAEPQTALRSWHRGGARPVLALHCSLAHAGAWSGLAEALHGVTITAPDQPGHGRSADWDGLSDLHDLTTQMAVGLAERLGEGGPVDLFGHSFGGTVALRVAIERPDLVRSLTLAEPVIFAAARASGHPAWGPFQAAHLGFADLIHAGQRAEAAALFHAQWGTGDLLSDLPLRQRDYILHRIHLIAAQNPALLDDSAALLRGDGLEAVQVPVLLIEGAISPPIIDAVHGELARRLPRVRRLSVPGAGHMVPITHAAALAGPVQAHLDGC